MYYIALLFCLIIIVLRRSHWPAEKDRLKTGFLGLSHILLKNNFDTSSVKRRSKTVSITKGSKADEINDVILIATIEQRAHSARFSITLAGDEERT